MDINSQERRSQMKIDFDSTNDLLYINFQDNTIKSATTEIIKPGVHADFDKDGKLIGIEVLEASKLIGNKIEFGLPGKDKISPNISSFKVY
jgi:uncharacterized protein YuzE